MHPLTDSRSPRLAPSRAVGEAAQGAGSPELQAGIPVQSRQAADPESDFRGEGDLDPNAAANAPCAPCRRATNDRIRLRRGLRHVARATSAAVISVAHFRSRQLGAAPATGAPRAVGALRSLDRSSYGQSASGQATARTAPSRRTRCNTADGIRDPNATASWVPSGWRDVSKLAVPLDSIAVPCAAERIALIVVVPLCRMRCEGDLHSQGLRDLPPPRGRAPRACVAGAAFPQRFHSVDSRWRP